LVLSNFDCPYRHFLDLTISNVESGYSYKNISMSISIQQRNKAKDS
jgi:hypothetical protein